MSDVNIDKISDVISAILSERENAIVTVTYQNINEGDKEKKGDKEKENKMIKG